MPFAMAVVSASPTDKAGRVSLKTFDGETADMTVECHRIGAELRTASVPSWLRQ